MRYYAVYGENHDLIGIGTGLGGVEITESEFNVLLTEIKKKAMLANRLYNGEITIDDVPEELQSEIQRRVNERIADEGEATMRDISDEEFMDMLEGVL